LKKKQKAEAGVLVERLDGAVRIQLRQPVRERGQQDETSLRDCSTRHAILCYDEDDSFRSLECFYEINGRVGIHSITDYKEAIQAINWFEVQQITVTESWADPLMHDIGSGEPVRLSVLRAQEKLQKAQ